MLNKNYVILFIKHHIQNIIYLLNNIKLKKECKKCYLTCKIFVK